MVPIRDARTGEDADDVAARATTHPTATAPWRYLGMGAVLAVGLSACSGESAPESIEGPDLTSDQLEGAMLTPEEFPHNGYDGGELSSPESADNVLGTVIGDPADDCLEAFATLEYFEGGNTEWYAWHWDEESDDPEFDDVGFSLSLHADPSRPIDDLYALPDDCGTIEVEQEWPDDGAVAATFDFVEADDDGVELTVTWDNGDEGQWHYLTQRVGNTEVVVWGPVGEVEATREVLDAQVQKIEGLGG